MSGAVFEGQRSFPLEACKIGWFALVFGALVAGPSPVKGIRGDITLGDRQGHSLCSDRNGSSRFSFRKTVYFQGFIVRVRSCCLMGSERSQSDGRTACFQKSSATNVHFHLYLSLTSEQAGYPRSLNPGKGMMAIIGKDNGY